MPELQRDRDCFFASAEIGRELDFIEYETSSGMHPASDERHQQGEICRGVLMILDRATTAAAVEEHLAGHEIGPFDGAEHPEAETGLRIPGRFPGALGAAVLSGDPAKRDAVERVARELGHRIGTQEHTDAEALAARHRDQRPAATRLADHPEERHTERHEPVYRTQALPGAEGPTPPTGATERAEIRDPGHAPGGPAKLFDARLALSKRADTVFAHALTLSPPGLDRGRDRGLGD